MTAKTQEVQTQPAEAQPLERSREVEIRSPRADVVETGASIVVVADMPGVGDKDIEITLEKNILTIVGHIAAPERKGHKLAYAEYGEGDYERSFALSEGVDRDRIEATVSNGVLRLTLPKAKEAAARKIAVRAG
jgi:HSP20 family protein